MEQQMQRQRHLFLTGEKHIGKSTALRKLLAGREGPAGGFRTMRIMTPAGGAIHMLHAGWEEDCTEENLLLVKGRDVDEAAAERFDAIGCAILAQSQTSAYLVMDELGPTEAAALAFQQAVFQCLEGDIPIYGVLQQAESRFLERIRAHPAVHVVTVTRENRDRLPECLRRQGW